MGSTGLAPQVSNLDSGRSLVYGLRRRLDCLLSRLGAMENRNDFLLYRKLSPMIPILTYNKFN